MSDPLYTDWYYLSAYIRELRLNLSLERIPAWINRDIATGRIQITEPLPAGWKLREKSRDRFDIEASGFCRDADSFGYRVRKRATSVREAELAYKAYCEDLLAKNDPVTVTLEQRALGRLIEKLKRDQARGRLKSVPAYKRIFVRAFRPDLSGRAFEEKLWPEAHQTPGVEPVKRGPPTRKK